MDIENKGFVLGIFLILRTVLTSLNFSVSVTQILLLDWSIERFPECLKSLDSYPKPDTNLSPTCRAYVHRPGQAHELWTN